MDGGRGGVRRAADVAVVVVQGDALASLHLESISARLGEAHSDRSRGVLILDDDADTAGRRWSVVKNCAGRSIHSKGGVGKRPDERGGDRDVRHKG